MSDTFITIIVVIAVALVMFIFPLMATANQNDDITQTSIQALVSEFVNTVAKEGKITTNNYDEFIQKLHATGNTYSVELEVRVLDDNPGSKTGDVIGENIYYSVFTNDILAELDNNQDYELKKGDYIKVKVHNTNVTFGTQMKNFLYSIIGQDTIAIAASSSALVTTTCKPIVINNPPENPPEDIPEDPEICPGVKRVPTTPMGGGEYTEPCGCSPCTGSFDYVGTEVTSWAGWTDPGQNAVFGHDHYSHNYTCNGCGASMTVSDGCSACGFGERTYGGSHRSCSRCGGSGYITYTSEIVYVCDYCGKTFNTEELHDCKCEHGVIGGHIIIN